jgi:hypothetical protein
VSGISIVGIMDLTQTLTLLKDAGLLWLFALIFAFPLGLLLFLVLAKRLLLKGSGTFVKTSVETMIQEQRKRVEIDVKMEERFRDLVEQFKLIGEGLWENRRTLDDRLRNFESLQRDNLDMSTKIFKFIPKRREDWIEDDVR